MNVDSYKEQMRINRGRLSSMDNELEDVWENSTDKFREFTLHTKCLGITKLAWIANMLSGQHQDEFVDWYYKNSPKKLQIETKLMEY